MRLAFKGALIIILTSQFGYAQKKELEMDLGISSCDESSDIFDESLPKVLYQEFTAYGLILRIYGIANCAGICRESAKFSNDTLYIDFVGGQETINYDTLVMDVEGNTRSDRDTLFLAEGEDKQKEKLKKAMLEHKVVVFERKDFVKAMCDCCYTFSIRIDGVDRKNFVLIFDGKEAN